MGQGRRKEQEEFSVKSALYSLSGIIIIVAFLALINLLKK